MPSFDLIVSWIPDKTFRTEAVKSQFTLQDVKLQKQFQQNSLQAMLNQKIKVLAEKTSGKRFPIAYANWARLAFITAGVVTNPEDELLRQREVVLDVLLGQDREARRDLADDRQRDDLFRRDFVLVLEDLEGAGLAGIAPQVALLLQRGEVAVDRGAAGQAEGLPNLTNAGRIPVRVAVALDEGEDLLLTPSESLAHDAPPAVRRAQAL